ncbi:MAG: DMT family transporter [Kiritimatiellae bacterium]|nr:DMT family transporter [Kiritimatiellia bacterium]
MPRISEPMPPPSFSPPLLEHHDPLQHVARPVQLRIRHRPVVALLRLHRPSAPPPTDQRLADQRPATFRSPLLPSLLCGLVLVLGSTLQQTAMSTTDPGKAGFLTALYILLVPLLQRLVGRPLRPLHLFCALLGTVGMALLCLTHGFGPLLPGDLLLLLCALAFACHILAIDRFAPALDPLLLSCLQFAVVGILSLPVIFLHETFPPLSAFRAAAVPFLYAAVFSCAIAYTLQVVAQRRVDPTLASLLMCLESVFALLAGALLLHERHTPRELLGCLLLFAAILLSHLPPRRPAR